MKLHEFNPDHDISATLESYMPDFKDGFEMRLIRKLVHLKDESYDYLFSRAFQKITMSGIAAVILLLISIYISDGAISIDSLVGTSNLDLESLTALTLTGN